MRIGRSIVEFGLRVVSNGFVVSVYGKDYATNAEAVFDEFDDAIDWINDQYERMTTPDDTVGGSAIGNGDHDHHTQ
jgi:hypothetical protein